MQNQGLRLCLGAFRTSPEKSLEVEAHIPPLELRREKLSLQYALKAKVNKTNPTHETMFTRNNRRIIEKRKSTPRPYTTKISNLLEEVNLPIEILKTENQAKDPPWLEQKPKVILDLCKKKKAETSSSDFKEDLGKIFEAYKEHTHIYTDGSKEGKKVGFAAHTPNGNLKGGLPGHASIFTAEAYAILRALDWVRVSSRTKFLILSDSKSCLQSIGQYSPTNPLVRDIRQTMTTLKRKGNDIVLCWLPSHIGIHGNEEADRAAKEALKLPPGIKKIPYTDMTASIREIVYEKWQSAWNEDRANKLHAIKPNVGRLRKSRGATRNEQVKLTRLQIGHSKLTHSYRLTREEAPKCEKCKKPLTIKHILLNCKKVKESRRKYLKNKRSMKDLFETILSTDIIKFVKETQLFDKL